MSVLKYHLHAHFQYPVFFALGILNGVGNEAFDRGRKCPVEGLETSIDPLAGSTLVMNQTSSLGS